MQESTQYEWRELVDRLRDEDASCVIRNGAETRVFRERGVKDLFRLLETDPAFLAGALVADKVVGKGAAALMVLGGVRAVHAGVVSTPALGLFAAAHIPVERDAVPRLPHGRRVPAADPRLPRRAAVTQPGACRTGMK